MFSVCSPGGGEREGEYSLSRSLLGEGVPPVLVLARGYPSQVLGQGVPPPPPPPARTRTVVPTGSTRHGQDMQRAIRLLRSRRTFLLHKNAGYVNALDTKKLFNSLTLTALRKHLQKCAVPNILDMKFMIVVCLIPPARSAE